MLYQAYDAAEAGDWSIFHELEHLFLRPYDEHEHLEAKYYRTTPMEFRNRQGISFYN
jgi:Zn-dependent peptidase ImmA (M78 family)